MKNAALITSVLIVLVLLLIAAGISGRNPVLAQSDSSRGEMRLDGQEAALSGYFPQIYHNLTKTPSLNLHHHTNSDCYFYANFNTYIKTYCNINFNPYINSDLNTGSHRYSIASCLLEYYG